MTDAVLGMDQDSWANVDVGFDPRTGYVFAAFERDTFNSDDLKDQLKKIFFWSKQSEGKGILHFPPKTLFGDNPSEQPFIQQLRDKMPEGAKIAAKQAAAAEPQPHYGFC